jgi:CRISPR-associated protein Cmr3
VDPLTLVGTVPGTDVRVRVEGVATGDPVMVGGWDLKHQRPRPLTPLVSAGAVYFLRVVQGKPEVLAQALHGRMMCDDVAMAKAGFGLVFVGRY